MEINWNCEQEDANSKILPEERCANGAIFHCTRPKEHEGQHHAHGIDGECYKVWD